MKRMITLVFLAAVMAGISTVIAQELSVNEKIDYINSLLKANPYRDTFMEVTFYYTIDITPDKELVVNMDFNGPFKTISKARILDLNSTLQTDTALEGTSSICWYCRNVDLSGKADCVYNESVTTQGEKETHYMDNICVMITRKGEIREKIINAFDELFRIVLEQ